VRIDILTLFPEMMESLLNFSIVRRAIELNLVQINVINFREYSKNKHKKVDDYSYGGGAGMLLTVQPIYDCLKSLEGIDQAYKIMTSPQGKTFHQEKAEELSKKDHIVVVCGHYEGMDHRILSYVDEEISIGDYVLTGGEIPAMVISDTIIRLIPGALNNAESSEIESFSEGLLEYPQYTRPLEFDGQRVPEVLLSGNHEEIRKWRKRASIENTYRRRKELLDIAPLDEEGKKILSEIKESKSDKNKKQL
jgi:tRNA (guanine37-N1)-methyltransferase